MKKRPLWIAALAVVSGILLNSGVQLIQQHFLQWPFYMDSIFTIVVGVFFGWAPGVLTGIGTNFLIELAHGSTGYTWPFFVVNAATGLCAGLMARNGEKFWTLSRQVLFVLVLTLVNAFLGAIVVTIVFGGMTGNFPDILVSAFVITGQNLITSAFMVRILINLVDKGIPVLLIYVTYRYLWPRIRRSDQASGSLGS